MLAEQGPGQPEWDPRAQGLHGQREQGEDQSAGPLKLRGADDESICCEVVDEQPKRRLQFVDKC